jgi:hypothetical protein
VLLGGTGLRLTAAGSRLCVESDLRAAFERLAPSLLVARQRGGAEMHGRTHCWSSEPG